MNFNYLLSLMDPTAFKLFGWPIQWYGIIVTTAMICGFGLFLFMLKKRNVPTDYGYETFIYTIILAIIGARFVYVVVRPEVYFPINSWDAFVNAIAIWEGGLTIIGGVFFGFFGVLISSKRNRQPTIATLDLLCPCLLIGQMIGRWGNYVNQEAYGLLITDARWQWFPFAVQIETGAGIEYHCATFFYEIVLNLIGLVIMEAVVRKHSKGKPGIVFCFYFVWYGFVRSCLEFVRMDAVTRDWGGVTVRITALYCSILAIVCIVLMLLIYFGKIKTGNGKFRTIADYEADMAAKSAPSEPNAVKNETAEIEPKQTVQTDVQFENTNNPEPTNEQTNEKTDNSELGE